VFLESNHVPERKPQVHVWMAPGLQEFVACGAVACSHVSGLSARSQHGPLALMGSADRGLIKSSGSKPANLLRLLSIRRVDRRRHHVSSLSQALDAAAGRYVMPPLPYVDRCLVYS
jgi:hypothetical protein